MPLELPTRPRDPRHLVAPRRGPLPPPREGTSLPTEMWSSPAASKAVSLSSRAPSGETYTSCTSTPRVLSGGSEVMVASAAAVLHEVEHCRRSARNSIDHTVDTSPRRMTTHLFGPGCRPVIDDHLGTGVGHQPRRYWRSPLRSPPAEVGRKLDEEGAGHAPGPIYQHDLSGCNGEGVLEHLVRREGRHREGGTFVEGDGLG